MADDAFPTRVRFSDGQYLEAGDLVAEQRYHLRMRWRHNLALHTWGILTGLEVTVEPANGSVEVARGMAFDGYGRELVLARNGVVRDIREPNADYDVLLVYSRRATDPGGQRIDSRARCGGVIPATREVEIPQIEVKKTADRLQSGADRPGEVPAGDLDFRAEQLAPDDTDHPWPVLLGRLSFRDGAWAVDSAVRRYAGIVAERIESPERPDSTARTAIVAGHDPALPDYRFAVVSGTAGSPPLFGVRAVANEHRIEFRAGRVSVAADFVLRDGSALEFQANPIRENRETRRLVGREQWRIYHHLEPPPKTGSAEPAEKAPSFSDELRITMPALPAGKNRVAIGSIAEGGAFAPILMVANDGTVTVNGSLTVKGAITGRIADAPGGATAAPVAGPGDEEILNRAAGILGRSTDKKRIGDFLAAMAVRDEGKEAIAEFVPRLADGQIQSLAARLWSDPNRAKLFGAAANSTEGGARVGTFKEFLFSFPDRVDKDSSTDPDSTTKTVKIVGDWFFTRADKAAEPIALVNYSAAKDEAIVQFVVGMKEPTALAKLQKLINLLIDDDSARGEIVQRLTASKHFDEVAGAVGKAFASNGNAGEFKSFVEPLFGGSTASALSSGGKAMAAAFLDYPGRLGTDPNSTPVKNLGIRAIASAMAKDLVLPLPTPPDLQSLNTRFRRYFDYVFRTNGDAEDDCKTLAKHVDMYAKNPKVPVTVPPAT